MIPLVKNIYRTALPSKTATCLACGKPIIFAVGKDSKFCSFVENETGCILINSDDSDNLKNSIQNIKSIGLNTSSESFYTKYCSMTTNSELYASCITRKDGSL